MFFFFYFKVNPDVPVLVAGDPERINMAQVDAAGGITYHQNQIDSCTKLASKLKIQPLKFL